MSAAGKVAGVSARRNYNQNCPIARGLDVLGERWTLLILRELVGGARRYGDLRAELPGIATNLLAERLKELAGRRARRPQPTYRRRSGAPSTRSATLGWQRVLPILQSIAWFGLDRLDPIDDAPGIAAQRISRRNPARLQLRPTRRAWRRHTASRSTAAVSNSPSRKAASAAARGEPAVTFTASAADLVTARLGTDEAERNAALRRIKFVGDAGCRRRAAYRVCAVALRGGDDAGSH